MTTTQDITTVRLPHTGLWMPGEQRMRITTYRPHPTSDGLAFTARLWLGKMLAGLIENHGTGGMTFFRPEHWRTFGEAELEAYAAKCSLPEGPGLNGENLLDTLVDEHDWAMRIMSYARRGRTLLREMNAEHIMPELGLPLLASGWTAVDIPRTDQEWRLVGDRVLADIKPGPTCWMQGWTGTAWRDVTGRPEGVNAELYG
jgi:hypothetical protein